MTFCQGQVKILANNSPQGVFETPVVQDTSRGILSLCRWALKVNMDGSIINIVGSIVANRFVGFGDKVIIIAS